MAERDISHDFAGSSGTELFISRPFSLPLFSCVILLSRKEAAKCVRSQDNAAADSSQHDFFLDSRLNLFTRRHVSESVQRDEVRDDVRDAIVDNHSVCIQNAADAFTKRTLVACAGATAARLLLPVPVSAAAAERWHKGDRLVHSSPAPLLVSECISRLRCMCTSRLLCDASSHGYFCASPSPPNTHN